VAEAVHHPTKNVLSNAAKLLANPELQVFNILQSMREQFSFKYVHREKPGAVKYGDREGHETSQDLEIRRPWNNLQ
jgi:hypothetical protein